MIGDRVKNYREKVNMPSKGEIGLRAAGVALPFIILGPLLLVVAYDKGLIK